MKREERLGYWGLIIILFWFLFHTCSNRPKELVETIVRTTDTVTKTKIRYIPFKVVETKTLYVPIATPFNEQIDKKDSSIIREYSSPYEDSLIKGNINVKVDGTLLAQSLLYTPKFPKYIIRTDSVIITNTVTKTLIEKKNRLLIGGQLSGNQSNIGISPMIGLKTKNNRISLIGYNIINKDFSVTFIAPIRFK